MIADAAFILISYTEAYYACFSLVDINSNMTLYFMFIRSTFPIFLLFGVSAKIVIECIPRTGV